MSAEHIVQLVLEAEYGGYHDPVARRVIRALADAGLLARPLPTREEIARAIADGWNSVTTLNATAQSICPSAAADAVLDILKGREA